MINSHHGTRREFLKSAPVAAAAATSPGEDPLLVAINDYRAGFDAFMAIPEEVLIEDEAGFVAATYGGPMERLCNWDQPARTRDGAVQALRLSLNEKLWDLESGKSLVKAALSYLSAN